MGSMQYFGLIATLRDKAGKEWSKVFGYHDTGDRSSEYRIGKRIKYFVRTPTGQRVWIQEMADYCDKHDLKVVCISSPATILTDVKNGSRVNMQNGAVWFPEYAMLSEINRPDLFAAPFTPYPLTDPARR